MTAQLNAIKSRIDTLRSTPTAKLVEYGKEYTLLARVEADHIRLIAALDAVISLVDLADSKGIVSGPPLEVDAIREAIAAALEAQK